MGVEPLHQMADGILRNDHCTAGADQLVDAVVDLRIQVVGSACQDDHRQMLLPGNFQIFCTLFPHLLLVCGMGGECLRHGVLDL